MNKLISTHFKKHDTVIDGISNKITLNKIENTHNVFHDLMSCVIEQQIHYRSTKKTFQKMMNAASLEILTLENFPILEKKGFKNVKLNARKYETILAVIDFFENNKIAWKKLEEAEVRANLSKIKGVGNWTIDMILLYTLEQPNIFPADDYHLRLIMTKLYNIDSTSRVKAQQREIAEQWNPYKSYATKYLLAWKNYLKGLGNK